MKRPEKFETTKEWYDYLNVRCHDLFCRLLTARVESFPPGYSQSLDWTEFNEVMSYFRSAMAELHAAKFLLYREEMLAPLKPIVFQVPEGDVFCTCESPSSAQVSFRCKNCGNLSRA